MWLSAISALKLVFSSWSSLAGTQVMRQRRACSPSCKHVNKAATASADNTRGRLELAKPVLYYGFYNSCKTENGPEDAFGEYLHDDESLILQCSCCAR